MHLPESTKRENQKPIPIDKKKKFIRADQKEWINSVKANIIKVNSTSPGFKYCGDNRPGGYQMVNAHQQTQYENR